MTEPFGPAYADAYDAIYRSKDYKSEVDLIERIFADHGLHGRQRVLDLGCGTGNHALSLAARGHSVIGVDRAPGMLARARTKASEAGIGRVAFHDGDIRELDLEQRFDAVLMMFTVLGYLTEEADVLAALKTVRGHLEPGGLFVFDVWNGPAVLADRPGAREVRVTEDAVQVTRKTSARLDVAKHLCHVHFDLERAGAGDSVERWPEDHTLRYYFPDELEELLWNGGLKLLNLRSFPNIEKPADERAWNVIGTAQAC